MKLGYVSRVHPKDNFNHNVLTIQGYKPKEFAGQINLNVNNMWGILKVCSNFLPKLMFKLMRLLDIFKFVQDCRVTYFFIQYLHMDFPADYCGYLHKTGRGKIFVGEGP